jgi:hypothetical protein
MQYTAVREHIPEIDRRQKRWFDDVALFGWKRREGKSENFNHTSMKAKMLRLSYE